jgi:hypothetical protein
MVVEFISAYKTVFICQLSDLNSNSFKLQLREFFEGSVRAVLYECF